MIDVSAGLTAAGTAVAVISSHVAVSIRIG
jgi:hypothetical protein